MSSSRLRRTPLAPSDCGHRESNLYAAFRVSHASPDQGAQIVESAHFVLPVAHLAGSSSRGQGKKLPRSDNCLPCPGLGCGRPATSSRSMSPFPRSESHNPTWSVAPTPADEAVDLSVDETTQIQVWNGAQAVLPLPASGPHLQGPHGERRRDGPSGCITP